MMGNIDKKTVGSGAQGLIHVSWLEKGWDVTRLFMNMVSIFSILSSCMFSFYIYLKHKSQKDVIPVRNNSTAVEGDVRC